MRNTTERRQQVLEHIIRQRRTELCVEFNVSLSTIRRDIIILSCSYPITTVQGGGGGIKIADGYRLGMKYLSPSQTVLLKKLSEKLTGEELSTMQSILKVFSDPGLAK